MVNLLISLILLFILNPIVTRHDRSNTEIQVEQKKFPDVVQLNLKDATGIVQMEGTFIRKDWIITAAHGLNSVEENQNVKLFNSPYVIKKIIVHPKFEGFENDIAVIQIDKKIPSMDPTPLYCDIKELNQDITIVGRGWSGTGNTGPVKNDQIFRMATNRIDSVSTHWLKFRFDKPDDPNTTRYEGISGYGDSGGPAFIELCGKRYLAGISSTQLNTEMGVKEGHYGVIEYYTRVSSYINWIEDAIAGKQSSPEILLSATNKWSFPETEIGEKAIRLMNAIAVKDISDQAMEFIFFKSFRESFDLAGFLQGIADSLEKPRIVEIKKARKNVLIFIIESKGSQYLMQLDADKRDGYKIGGLIYKKLE